MFERVFFNEMQYFYLKEFQINVIFIMKMSNIHKSRANNMTNPQVMSEL